MEGRPPAGSRPKTSPTPASRDQNPAPVTDTAQLDLESYRAELATNARDTGQVRAARSDPDYCRDVGEWIYNLPTGYEFTADTIRSAFGASPASGSVLSKSAKDGAITHIGWTTSKAITRHAAPLRVWRRM